MKTSRVLSAALATCALSAVAMAPASSAPAATPLTSWVARRQPQNRPSSLNSKPTVAAL
ncbi:hypothetical protein [Rothia terrae]|uniref:hypothetical protein n=1 Tax=Rothia terrae TaxID=396015 RepID=UPI001D157232|nr:hypothetical protein [Rothia terrae]